MTDFNIFSNPRKSRYDPDLARRVNEEKEAVIRTPKEKPKADVSLPIPSYAGKAKINLSDYVQVPGHNVLIRKEEELKGKTWNETHYELAKNGLFMPRIDHFMAHFMNVRNAYERSSKLHDASGNELNQSETEDLWKYLSTNHRNGCYTWLDALFKEEKGKIIMETDHRAVGKKLQSHTLDLDAYCNEDSFVDLKFNSQGLPTSKSRSQTYQQGKNTYFYHPRTGRVARFDAGSGRADLSGGNGPDYRGGSLGVRKATAGGGSQKI